METRFTITDSNEDQWVRAEFSSVSALLDFATDETAGRSTAAKVFCNANLQQIKGAWYNGYTVAKLQQSIVHVPSVLTDAVESVKQQLLDQITPPVQPKRIRRNRLELGDELDPMAWVHRDPEGWSDMHRVSKPKSLVKIAVDVGCSCDFTAEHLRYRGAAIMALTDLLEQYGIGVDITVFDATADISSDIPKLLAQIQVKRAGDTMDIGSVAMATAEIGFYRAAFLVAEARLARVEPNSGFGCVAQVPTVDRAGFDLVIQNQIRSFDSAVEFVKREMSQRIGA